MAEAGTLLLPRYLLPVRPARTVLFDQAVRIAGGRIDAVMPASEALERFPRDQQIDLDRHVLMPGLINMHTHSPMSLLRGYADDLALDDWLRKHIWPAEQRWVSPEFVRDGMHLALAEMLRGGVTGFNEMYFFPEVMAETVAEVGMRASIGVPIIDVPTPWAGGIGECLDKASSLMADWSSHELIDIALAPHAPYTVDDKGLAATAGLARESRARVDMHVLEAAWEIAQSMDSHGMGSLERLDRHGLLGPGFLAVHMVQIDAEDIARVAATGTNIAHCPESNLKLANGVAPIPRLLEAGVNVCLGTDGAASNNNLDLLGEARTAALVAKGFSGDPEALSTWETLDLLTIGGARALGRDDDLGTIEAGKIADLCALDLAAPETQPLHNIASQLVYSASSRQFSDVWVAGQQLLVEGEPVSEALRSAPERAAKWQERLATTHLD